MDEPKLPMAFIPAEQAIRNRQHSTARLAGKTLLYFQGSRQSPLTCFEHVFSDRLRGDDRPYIRPGNLLITPEWQPLDLGWLAPDNVSMICLRNDGSGKLPTNIKPRPEQVEAEMRLVIELASQESLECVWEIPLNQFFQGRSRSPWALRVRCRNGEVKATLVVFPR